MGARNGQSVFDILTAGWRRKVTPMNKDGTLGVSIPADILQELGIEKGDEVAMKPADDREGVLEVHFE